MDFNKSIDTIKQQLHTLHKEECINNNKPIEIPPEASLLIKNRVYTGMPIEYKILMQRKKQKDFWKKGVLEKKNTPDHLLNGSDNFTQNLLEDMDLTYYKRPWGKLEHELKINRAMHYAEKEIALNKLTIEQGKKLKILLIRAINKRIITKKSDVEYNAEEGTLIKINCLKFDTDTKTYSIDRLDKNGNKIFVPKNTEKGFVSHISKLSPDQDKLFKGLTF